MIAGPGSFIKTELRHMTFWKKEFIQRSAYRFLQKHLGPLHDRRKMLVLLRQGKISKWFSGIGRKQLLLLAPHWHLQEDEWSCRCTVTRYSLPAICRSANSSCNGRGPRRIYKRKRKKLHFGNRKHHIRGMISHLGLNWRLQTELR